MILLQPIHCVCVCVCVCFAVMAWSADYMNSVMSKRLMSCQIWEPGWIGHGARSCTITQKQPLGWSVNTNSRRAHHDLR